MNNKEEKYYSKHSKGRDDDIIKCALKLLCKETAKYLQKKGYDVDKNEMEWNYSDGFCGYNGHINFAPNECIRPKASYSFDSNQAHNWDYDSEKRSILEYVAAKDKENFKKFLKEVKKYCKEHDRYEEPEGDVER